MKLSGDNYMAFCGFALMGAIGLWFAFTPKIITPLRILTDTRTAIAQIAETGSKDSNSRAGINFTSYQFSYTFTVDGTVYSSRNAFDHLPNATEPIMYAPFDPNLNGPELRDHAYIDLGIGGIILAVFAGSIAMLVWHHRSAAAASGRQS